VERAGAWKLKLKLRDYYTYVLVSLESFFEILTGLVRGYR